MAWNFVFQEEWSFSTGPTLNMNNAGAYAANVAADDVIVAWVMGLGASTNALTANSAGITTPAGFTPVGSPARGLLITIGSTHYYGYIFAFWAWANSVPTNIAITRTGATGGFRCGWMNFRSDAAEVPTLYGDTPGHLATPALTYPLPAMTATMPGYAMATGMKYDSTVTWVDASIPNGFTGTTLPGPPGPDQQAQWWIGHKSVVGAGSVGMPTLENTFTVPPPSVRFLTKSWLLGTGAIDHQWRLCGNGTDTGSTPSNMTIPGFGATSYDTPCDLCG